MCGDDAGRHLQEAEETIKVVNLLKPLLEPYAEVGAYDESRNAFEDAGSGILAAGLRDGIMCWKSTLTPA